MSRDSSPGQHFDLTADGHLVSGLDATKCLDSSRTNQIGLLVMFSCNNVAWQQWIAVNGVLVNKQDNMCLTVREASPIAGVSLSTQTCDGSDSQRFDVG